MVLELQLYSLMGCDYLLNIFRIMFDSVVISNLGICLYVVVSYHTLNESFSVNWIFNGFYNLLDSERGSS